jgi:maltooligosyltrehalose synthase
MAEEKGTNYSREAFLHPLNLLMLIVATTAAFFLNDVGMVPTVIFSLAFGMELMYLGTVPNLPNFRKAVDARKARERKKADEHTSVFQGLDRESQRRFLVLKHLSKLIRENFQKLPYTSQGLLDNIGNKIEGLLSNYLNLLDMFRKYETYLRSSTESKVADEILKEREEMEESTSEKLRSIKARRINILNKRLERFKTAREKFAIAETQLETIEDAVRYVYEQSMTMNNPEEIGFQLDNLLLEVEETATLMEEVEADMLPSLSMLDEIDLGTNGGDAESRTGTQKARESS